jgi:hypothetical protein
MLYTVYCTWRELGIFSLQLRQTRKKAEGRNLFQLKDDNGLGRLIIHPPVNRLWVEICVCTCQVSGRYRVSVEFVISHVKITSK